MLIIYWQPGQAVAHLHGFGGVSGVSGTFPAFPCCHRLMTSDDERKSCSLRPTPLGHNPEPPRKLWDHREFLCSEWSRDFYSVPPVFLFVMRN